MYNSQIFNICKITSCTLIWKFVFEITFWCENFKSPKLYQKIEKIFLHIVQCPSHMTWLLITEIFKVKAYLWCYTCYFNSDKCPRLCQVHRTHLTNKNIFVHVTFYMYIFRTWGYHHCNPLIFYIPVHMLHVHVTCVLQVLWIITHMALTRLLPPYRNLS